MVASLFSEEGEKEEAKLRMQREKKALYKTQKICKQTFHIFSNVQADFSSHF